MPPSPAPSTTMVFPLICLSLSEYDHFVGPGSPGSELGHAAAVAALYEIGVGDAARVQAGTANADPSAVVRRHLQHLADVVVALRHLLAGLGTGGSVADEKDIHLVASGFILKQLARKADAVVTAFGAIRWIVQDE